MATDPQLPPLSAVSQWVHETRNEVGLTLTELGDAAHLSASQLSRLESGEGNPSYEAVHRVYTELKKQQGEATVATVLRGKRDNYDSLKFEFVEPTDTCADAAALMDTYSISQLPVIEDGHAVGSVSDTTLVEIEADLMSISVGDIADPPFPEVYVTADQDTVRNLLQSSQAVLLLETEDADIDPVVGPYVGLLTAADFR